MLRRHGIGTPFIGPTIWAHVERQAAFDEARPIIEQLMLEHRRYRVYVTAPSRRLRQHITKQLPEAFVEAPPLGNEILLWRLFGRIQPHLILILGQTRRLTASVFKRAARYPLPVVVLDDRNASTTTTGGLRALRAARRVLVEDRRRMACLEAQGVIRERLWLLPPHDGGHVRVEAAVRAIAGTPRVDQADPASTPVAALVRAARAWVRSPPGRRLIARHAQRIETLEALHDALGGPRTILCLGNGPSSVSPELNAIAFDALFRVNHRWQNDGFLTGPDMVFTGDPATVHAVETGILGFRTLDEEAQLLARCLWRPPPRQFAYATLERLPVSINDRRWPARPTNGAAMVALAAALRPQRLIIAGIDLFEHTEGAYPNEPDIGNMYFIVHDRAVDLAVIEHALEAFHGEVTILSPPLATRLGLPRG
ncbi:MAG: hypothetical protein KDK91_10850 [Gammaproteobacteria bacterium]|nr:hypothetical protein [Gammaproteobacteria bacterium]